jgi:hypothetical protein
MAGTVFSFIYRYHFIQKYKTGHFDYIQFSTRLHDIVRKEEICMDTLSMEQFHSWLSAHATTVVGQAGMCFLSPLALWISERMGHLYGTDDLFYGRAVSAYCSWQMLPAWAVRFNARLERIAFRPVTGLEALQELAHIKTTIVFTQAA